ncbi:lipoprotein-releasing ABC transporter permease subunit LolE [Candidatus Gillettellia adelgis]
MVCTLLSFLTALRFSRGQKRGGILSLMSATSTLSVTLGVAIVIISLSTMNGFQREFKHRILSVVPHGEIEVVHQPFQNWRSILQRINKVPGILAAAPYIQFTSLLENSVHLHAVQVKGIDPQQENQISILPQFVQNDAWSHFKSGERQIILGKGVADALAVNGDSYITMIIPNSDPRLRLLQPQRIRLHVIGILQLSGQLDHNLGLVPLSDAQQYLNMGNSITGIAIKVNQVFNANKLVYDAAKVTNTYVYIKSWIRTYGYIYNDIQMIRTIMYLAMILIISMACFNIIATLMMAVKDKIGDIAILRTLGAKNSFIRAIFIWYGLLTGLIGSFSGMVVGVVCSLQLTTIMNSVKKLTGHAYLSGKVYFIDFLPSELHRLDLVIVIVITLILSLLASWYPAKRASCIDPASVLSRY